MEMEKEKVLALVTNKVKMKENQWGQVFDLKKTNGVRSLIYDFNRW